MIARLRLISILFLCGLLIACQTSSSSKWGAVPDDANVSIEQLLAQADKTSPQKAAPLLLSAANKAYQQQDYTRAESILNRISQGSLKPAQIIYANTLKAELAMQRDKPQIALRHLHNIDQSVFVELPVALKIRTHEVRANALAADRQTLEALRERIRLAPLLGPSQATANQEIIWTLATSLPTDQLLNQPNEPILNGWLELAAIGKKSHSLKDQQERIERWVSLNPEHPAARQLPSSLQKRLTLTAQPSLKHIALLLPRDGQLAAVGQALQEGFLTAHYLARQDGHNTPDISLYDSTQITSIDDLYRRAQSEGIDMIIGPLEKPLVKELSGRLNLPIPTLALNYNESSLVAPPELFQYGLSAEDEARSAANKAWSDGQRRAIVLVPRGDWGNRVQQAFIQNWHQLGGTLIATQYIDQPMELAQQLADLLQLRDSESRSAQVRSVLNEPVASQPARRQDVDFIFLAATPQQARQINPTLAFQYAGDLPVYATSHIYNGSNISEQNQYLNGIFFCETPWLLDPSNPVRRKVVQQWPNASGSMGRLYAMGVDTYYLSMQLQEMKQLPDVKVKGLTGELELTPERRIERHLPWAQFQNGQIRSLGSETY